MSREIKFRVWDKFNKCWLNLYKILISKGGDVIGAIDINDDQYGLHQVELLRYTGLKDKNGKEIYEEDLLSLNEGYEKFIVKFGKYFDNNETHYGFYLENFYSFGRTPKIMPFNLEFKSPEIIGNVWENPELLPEANK